jgi:hypothetical protein
MSETTTEKPAEATAEKKAVPAMKAILAKKIGMTRVFSPKGEIVPVTVFQAGPCRVVQVKTPATDGYAALQLGFGDIRPKNFSKSEAGHFAKTNGAPTRGCRSFVCRPWMVLRPAWKSASNSSPRATSSTRRE